MYSLSILINNLSKRKSDFLKVYFVGLFCAENSLGKRVGFLDEDGKE